MRCVYSIIDHNIHTHTIIYRLHFLPIFFVCLFCYCACFVYATPNLLLVGHCKGSLANRFPFTSRVDLTANFVSIIFYTRHSHQTSNPDYVCGQNKFVYSSYPCRLLVVFHSHLYQRLFLFIFIISARVGDFDAVYLASCNLVS